MERETNDPSILTAYLCVRNAEAALAFYCRAFGATQTMSIAMPDGKIGHSEMTIFGARIMISD